MGWVMRAKMSKKKFQLTNGIYFQIRESGAEKTIDWRKQGGENRESLGEGLQPRNFKTTMKAEPTFMTQTCNKYSTLGGAIRGHMDPRDRTKIWHSGWALLLKVHGFVLSILHIKILMFSLITEAG